MPLPPAKPVRKRAPASTGKRTPHTRPHLRALCVFAFQFLAALFTFLPNSVVAADSKPNILWIVVEDASPHIGSYSETTIQTPFLDALANRGVRFTNAFVTCPVCSPSRSAMVTGMYQTTLGTHNHRSQGETGKAKGGPEYLSSYRLPVASIPELFQQAGYYTCNSQNGLPNSKNGKTDYNFAWDKRIYDAADWATREPNQPFFAQVQLKGGKNRKAQHGTDPATVHLPPYYPDHPVLRRDWANYLDSWVEVDRQVAAIFRRLDDEGIADSTAVFLWTDHGVSHLRGKQYLYEEGIRVPLIALLPKSLRLGSRADGPTVRDDLVTQIDIAKTSLALAGIENPAVHARLQGRDLFGADYQPCERVFSARDRCDETVDFIRCVRTGRYKYIRNFMPHLAHAQPNQYKDGKRITQTMRQLHRDGILSEIQAKPFNSSRPAEELYDLENDPHELNNLAANPAHKDQRTAMRQSLYEWMRSSGDLGVIPEPVLEELGKRAGNKFSVLQSESQRAIVPEILAVLDSQRAPSGNAGIAKRDSVHVGSLTTSLQHSHPAVRYWAATELGLRGKTLDAAALEPLLDDSFGGVRVAAALARCRLNATIEDVQRLVNEADNLNYIVGMYAIRALELLPAELLTPHIQSIQGARQNPYEFTRRIARRLSSKLEN